MARITLDTDKDHLVTPKHSDARGPVVRGQSIEIMQMNWRTGDSARPHQHPEEQAIYVVSGRMRMTVGGETYEIGPGEVELPSVQRAARRARRRGHGGDQLQEHRGARLPGDQDAVADCADLVSAESLITARRRESGDPGHKSRFCDRNLDSGCAGMSGM